MKDDEQILESIIFRVWWLSLSQDEREAILEQDKQIRKGVPYKRPVCVILDDVKE